MPVQAEKKYKSTQILFSVFFLKTLKIRCESNKIQQNVSYLRFKRSRYISIVIMYINVSRIHSSIKQ